MIWHTGTPADVLRELKAEETGLAAAAAQNRQKEYGKNRLPAKAHRSLLTRFIEQLQNTMVIILLIAALVSLAVCIYNTLRGNVADWAQPIIIVVILLLNAVVGVVHQTKTDDVLKSLEELSASNAKVWRDGILTTVPFYDIVPGDVVTFEAGDMIPADCRLLQAEGLVCDESAVTADETPACKDADALLDTTCALGTRVNMVYSGTAVCEGSGVAVVTAIGTATEIGRVAAMLGDEKDAVTPIQRRMAQLGKQLGFLVLAICLVVFVLGLFNRIPALDIFMTAVALAVAAIPEGLPVVVAVILAGGVHRMVKQNILVRNLSAVETFGSASVICSDKTGSLTQNRMTLTRAFVGNHMEDLRQNASDGALALVRLSLLCTDGNVQITEENVEQHIGNPTETGIVAFALHQGISKEDLFDRCPRLGSIPFDGTRKLMTVVHLIDGESVVIVKGAPEVLLGLCTDGSLDEAAAAAEQMGKSALRVLAVACKKLHTAPADFVPEELENGLTLLGLLGLADPPRQEAVDAVVACRAAGISPVMITADQVETACAVATQMGILTPETEAITGAELAEMDDKELKKNIHRFSVFARVTPSDKLRIMKAWRRRGDVVAMTGDGILDAPVLKAADIGCAMGTVGTDVARDAADITVLDDNFATVTAAVKFGRGIYDNIRKAVQFLLACNLGEILTVLFAILIWGEPSLLPLQLLWINLLTDSFPAFALSAEEPETDIMRRAPRARKESLFSGGLAIGVIWQGIMIGALAILAYGLGSRAFTAEINTALGNTMAFSTLVFAQVMHAFNVRSSHSLFEVGFFTNRRMISAFVLALTIMLLVLLIAPLGGLIGLVAMNGVQWGIVAALSLVPLIVMETYKYFKEHRALIAPAPTPYVAVKAEEEVLDVPTFVDADQQPVEEEIQQEFYNSEAEIPAETVTVTEETAQPEQETEE